MKRPFNFKDTTKREAFKRQWNLCAHCGENLSDFFDHAHHVIPNQTGRAGNVADQFLRTVDNCVILCDTCHERVHHDGSYRTGAVAPPEYYPYSHGKDACVAADRKVLLLTTGLSGTLDIKTAS
jgi:5-methylcytosine-specific restriction endonuclease McrA